MARSALVRLYASDIAPISSRSLPQRCAEGSTAKAATRCAPDSSESRARPFHRLHARSPLQRCAAQRPRAQNKKPKAHALPSCSECPTAVTQRPGTGCRRPRSSSKSFDLSGALRGADWNAGDRPIAVAATVARRTCGTFAAAAHIGACEPLHFVGDAVGEYFPTPSWSVNLLVASTSAIWADGKRPNQAEPLRD